MPGRVSDMMYHESAISDACGSVTTTRPSVQEPGTSASEASTPIRLSEQEPVTPSIDYLNMIMNHQELADKLSQGLPQLDHLVALIDHLLVYL